MNVCNKGSLSCSEQCTFSLRKLFTVKYTDCGTKYHLTQTYFPKNIRSDKRQIKYHPMTSVKTKAFIKHRTLLMLAVYQLTVLNKSCLIVLSQYTIRFQAGGQEREGKGTKLDPIPTVEFILKLHPEEKKEQKQ